MAYPLKHAESSARKFGGKAEDYPPIHNWFDESKAFFSDFPTEPYAPAAPNMTTQDAGYDRCAGRFPLCCFYPLTTLRLAICFAEMKIWDLVPLLLNYGVHACLELSRHVDKAVPRRSASLFVQRLNTLSEEILGSK
jgi:hypothetical protein